jgi:hypothetical protein
MTSSNAKYLTAGLLTGMAIGLTLALFIAAKPQLFAALM